MNNRLLLSLTVLAFLASLSIVPTAHADRDFDRSVKRHIENHKPAARQHHRQAQRQKAVEQTRKRPQRQREGAKRPQRQTRTHQNINKREHRRDRSHQSVRRDNQRRIQPSRNFEHSRKQLHRRATRSHARRHVRVNRSSVIRWPGYRTNTHRRFHVPRNRHYRGIRIYRPYGYLYPGFGFYYSDYDAYRWIAFTALTLAVIDQLTEQQQRMHEQALINATTAYEGDTIRWRRGSTFGSVTVVDTWTDSRGRECREFKQSITRYGRVQTDYGIVCQQFNGTWEVSSIR